MEIPVCRVIVDEALSNDEGIEYLKKIKKIVTADLKRRGRMIMIVKEKCLQSSCRYPMLM